MLLSCSVGYGGEAPDQGIDVADDRPHDDGSGADVQRGPHLSGFGNSAFADRERMQFREFRRQIQSRKPASEGFHGITGERGREEIGSGETSASPVFNRCAIRHRKSVSRMNRIN
jgi:hypothetical protein